jgi:hypothetical protein
MERFGVIAIRVQTKRPTRSWKKHRPERRGTGPTARHRDALNDDASTMTPNLRLRQRASQLAEAATTLGMSARTDVMGTRCLRTKSALGLSAAVTMVRTTPGFSGRGPCLPGRASELCLDGPDSRARDLTRWNPRFAVPLRP